MPGQVQEMTEKGKSRMMERLAGYSTIAPLVNLVEGVLAVVYPKALGAKSGWTETATAPVRMARLIAGHCLDWGRSMASCGTD
jgi:hypothetical protein